MKVLVTGGAGFIGRHTVRALLREGSRVTVVDDFTSSKRDHMLEFSAHPGFDLIEADASDDKQLAHAFASACPDAVVHLAGLVSVPKSFEEPEESRRLNVDAAEQAADIAARYDCARFVFASSAAVYGDLADMPLREDAVLPHALSPYGQHKAEAEQKLMARFDEVMSCISMRYFNVYGKGQPVDSPYSGVITRFVDCARRRAPLLVFGDGEQTRDFVHVEDVALVNAKAAFGVLVPGIYNVCNGTGTSLNELISLLRARYPETVVQHQPSRQGEIRHSLGRSEKLASALGEWSPISFAAGIAGLLDD